MLYNWKRGNLQWTSVELWPESVESVESLCMDSSSNDDEANSTSVDESKSVEPAGVSVVEMSMSSISMSSSSSHHSSPWSSSSIGLLVVSIGSSSSSTHGSLLQSSDENAIVSSPHLAGATAFPSAMHSTLRDRLPPPHFLLQSFHGPVNHWPSHFLPLSHSFEFSGFCDASHFDSSSAGLTPPASSCPQSTFLVWTPVPQSTEQLLHCDENHWNPHSVVWLHDRLSSGNCRLAQNVSL